MKILFFASYYLPYISGITTCPYHLFNGLKEENEIKILTFRHNPQLPEKEIINGSEVKRMPYTFKISKGFISIQSLFIFWKESKKADVIILNIPNFEGVPLAVIGKLRRKKILSIYHCQVELGQTFIKKLISRALKLAVGIQLKLSDHIVAYTEEYAKRTNLFPKYQNKTTVILPPMPLPQADEKFLQELKKQKGEKIWIGFAGRIAREKGVENLVEAVAQIKERDITRPIKIVLCGSYGKEVVGEEEYYEEIVRKLKSSGLDYHFFGNLSNENLAAFYKSIDLLVLPSVNKTEAFGMVQAEAMMSGTPVIATDMPGVRVPIILTKMGELVKPGDIKELGKTIEKVINSISDYNNQSKIKNAREVFSIENSIEKYKNAIYGLLK